MAYAIASIASSLMPLLYIIELRPLICRYIWFLTLIGCFIDISTFLQMPLAFVFAFFSLSTLFRFFHYASAILPLLSLILIAIGWYFSLISSTLAYFLLSFNNDYYATLIFSDYAINIATIQLDIFTCRHYATIATLFHDYFTTLLRHSWCCMLLRCYCQRYYATILAIIILHTPLQFTRHIYQPLTAPRAARHYADAKLLLLLLMLAYAAFYY